jgi:hypothetical protein
MISPMNYSKTNDWKLVRAILRDENTAHWPNPFIREHMARCVESGWLQGQSMRHSSGSVEVLMSTIGPRLSRKGEDMAAELANLDSLDAALNWLEAEKKEASEENLVLQLKRVAEKKS